MATTQRPATEIESIAPAGVPENAADAVVFEGVEAEAFAHALDAGTASAAYLDDADRLFASLFRSEPANGLVA